MLSVATKIVRYGVYTAVFVFLLITCTPLVRWMAERMQQDWYGGNGEALIILGGSMLVPGHVPNATLGFDTYLRCVYASWVLQKQTFHWVVVTGDSGAAQQMAVFLEQRGISASSILVESAARSTYENALFTKKILQQRLGCLPPVVILTSDFHSWRARRVFEHVGLQTRVIAVPDVIKRSSFPSERWGLFLLLLGEFKKDVGYTILGRI